jgi:hypothetical protein
MLALPAMWRGFSAAWQRSPPDRHRRSVVVGTVVALYLVVAGLLAATAPWGPHSIAYVIAIGFGGPWLLCMIGIAALAIQERGALGAASRRSGWTTKTATQTDSLRPAKCRRELA